MTLIGILGALLLERLLSHWAYWRTHDLSGRWQDWLRTRLPHASFWRRGWGLVVLIAPVLLLVVGVLLLIEPLGAVIELAASIAVLLACLGPRDLAEEIRSYQAACEQRDLTRAADLLRDIGAGPGEAAATRSPAAASFVQGHERWFGVLLWFFVLGAGGALLYRLSAATAAHLRRSGADAELLRTADAWHGVLAWAPARITALCYLLAGSADHAAAAWREWREGPTLAQDPWSLLATVGVASLARDAGDDSVDCLDASLNVMGRALLILLAVLSLFTLGGWLA